MPLTMPMMPVALLIEVNSIRLKQTFSFAKLAVIPLPDCQLHLSINGSMYKFNQARTWNDSMRTMAVVLTKAETETFLDEHLLDSLQSESGDRSGWECVDKKPVMTE